MTREDEFESVIENPDTSAGTLAILRHRVPEELYGAFDRNPNYAIVHLYQLINFLNPEEQSDRICSLLHSMMPESSASGRAIISRTSIEEIMVKAKFISLIDNEFSEKWHDPKENARLGKILKEEVNVFDRFCRQKAIEIQQAESILENQDRFNEFYARALQTNSVYLQSDRLLQMLDTLNRERAESGMVLLEMNNLEKYRKESPITNQPHSTIMSDASNQSTQAADKRERVSENRIDESKIDFTSLAQLGITRERLERIPKNGGKSQLEKLLETGKSDLITGYAKIGDLSVQIEGKLQAYEKSDGSVELKYNSVRTNLSIPPEVMGYTFTPEDKLNLLRHGSTFTPHEVTTKGGKAITVFFGVDPETKNLEIVNASRFTIQNKLMDRELNPKEKEALMSGKPVFLEGLHNKAENRTFDSWVYINPGKGALSFVSKEPKIEVAQHQTQVQTHLPKQTVEEPVEETKARKNRGMKVK